MKQNYTAYILSPYSLCFFSIVSSIVLLQATDDFSTSLGQFVNAVFLGLVLGCIGGIAISVRKARTRGFLTSASVIFLAIVDGVALLCLINAWHGGFFLGGLVMAAVVAALNWFIFVRVIKPTVDKRNSASS